MRTSLSRRLLLSLSAVVVAAWVATAIFSYLDARDRIGRMLDDHLVQAAHLLLGSRSNEPSRPPAHWGTEAEGHSLVYQGWSDDGRLLFRSADAPETPLSERAEGFTVVERHGAVWRVFGVRAPGGSLRVQVAEHAAFRDELAGSIARHPSGCRYAGGSHRCVPSRTRSNVGSPRTSCPSTPPVLPPRRGRWSTR